MTFPGESLPIAGSGNVVGAPILPGTLTYRAESSTFGPGDEAWVDVPLTPLLLAPGDTAEVSWVLEVIGGSGVLDLSEDAGSLGSHTAATGTLVVPSSLTAADVLAGGTARLTVACTSGTVQVQQIKLRVWPVGGPLGGLSAPYTPPPVSVPVDVETVAPTTFVDTGYITGTDIDTVFQDTETLLAGEIGGKTVGDPPYFFSTPLSIAAQFAVNASYTPGAIPPAEGSGTIGVSVAYIERSGDPFTPDPAGTFGVDWVYPPNEVPYDPDGWQYVGTPSWGWAQGVATITVNIEAAGDPDGNFRVGADPVAAVDPPATEFIDIIRSANMVAVIEATPLLPDLEFDLPPMSDTGMLRLAFWHDGANPPPLMGATQTSTSGAGVITTTTGDANANVYLGRYIDGVFQPVQASYTRPYRYWTPTAVTPSPHLIFWRHDNLGAGGNLVFQPNTRQSTGLVFGNN